MIIEYIPWQIQATLGLILLDLALGVASALKRGVFDWKKTGEFYKTNVLPYVIGYAAFYVVVVYIFEGIGDMPWLYGTTPVLQEGVVSLAWAALVSNMVSSIHGNFKELYQ